MNMDVNEYYDTLLEYEVADEKELGVAIHFGGYTKEALDELLFYKTGYRDIEQFLETLEE